MTLPPPHDPFGLCRPGPVTYDRQHRVLLLDECFGELLAGRMPGAEAALFTAAGGMGYLQGKGDLLRDLWQITAPAGSHLTAPVTWARVASSSRKTSAK